MEKIVITFATAKSGVSPYLDFNSPQAAVVEVTTGPVRGLLFIDTREDEVGFFLNFLHVDEETGRPYQWVSDDPCLLWADAIGELANLAARVGTSGFFTWLSSAHQVA